jgi:hypothetical protein
LRAKRYSLPVGLRRERKRSSRVLVTTAPTLGLKLLNPEKFLGRKIFRTADCRRFQLKLVESVGQAIASL